MTTNTRFRDYVRSAAFHLILSEQMISALRETIAGKAVSSSNLSYLERRGLIHYCPPDATNPWQKRNNFVVSEAGELVYKLLEIAELVQ